MFESDHHIICQSLNMWANYIETGDVNMSQYDALNCNKPNTIQKLSQSQITFIEKIRALAADSFNKKINLTENTNVRFQ